MAEDSSGAKGNTRVLKCVFPTNVQTSAIHYFAATEGKEPELQRLLDAGADATQAEEAEVWSPPLLIAAEQGNADAVRMLALAGADASVRDGYQRGGVTALHVAATHGDADIMAVLLEKGADPNALDRHGVSPLHNACAYGRIAAAKVLVAAGANLNARSQCFNRDTPLHIALRGKADAPATLEIVTLLVEAGADVTVRNKSGIGELPDELAYMCGKIDSGVVLLAKRGFGPRARGIHAS